MKKAVSATNLFESAIALLKRLIETPSVSGKEDATADMLVHFLRQHGVQSQRVGNNLYAINRHFDPKLPTLLLNSHHDTVPPNKHFSRDPYKAVVEDGCLYGLGANDAGGSLVALLAAFLFFYESQMAFNVIFAASAEEEISGKNGMEDLLRNMPKPDMAIVGEPTQMKMAVAEKGLIVFDGVAEGVAGHAARDEGRNAINDFVADFNWLQQEPFSRVSPFLGKVHTAITVVQTKNTAHNVVPDECRFVIDVRVNELYSLDDIVRTLREGMRSHVTPRSLRLKPSFIPTDHPLVEAGATTAMEMYGSPTLSDMALMHFPAVKCGPGDSARSHTADEFIFEEEINRAIQTYIVWIQNLDNLINRAR